jgi:arginyl-tRNA synthetase
LVYITDIGQFNHFDLVFRGAEMAKWYDPKVIKVEHMGFGIVLGEDGTRMKTRGGETVRLMTLLDEANERAMATLKLSPEEYKDAAEKLGIAAIKYFDLRQNRTQNYKFDFDSMLTPIGDTAVYLIYSYARVCSVIKKSGLTKEDLEKGEFKFTQDHEKKLAAH